MQLNEYFSTNLIAWYEKKGRKNLPWKTGQCAYHTWVSEIMLQQTQVETVKGYFNRFIKNHPNILHLANAPEDNVMRDWAGLGYYSRARNLHKTAITLKNQGLKNLPNNLEQLIALPGIGRSTAGAILALGFREHGVILDGNVKRVLSRFFGIFKYPYHAHGDRHFWFISELVTPKKQCAEYTQAIMDIGATVCHLKQPECYKCPIQTRCYANQNNIQHFLPQKKIRKKQTIFNKVFVFPILKNKVGLIRNEKNKIWNGLWCPLIYDVNDPSLKNIRNKPFIQQYKHIFSHQIWYIDCYVLVKDSCFHTIVKKWHDFNELTNLGLPKPVKVILERIDYEKDHVFQIKEGA